jgi:pyochelin biosynthetic protein PchC
MTTTTANPWLRSLRETSQASHHVLFFPHAGGSATYFHPFAGHLPDSLSVWAAQYPGRQDRRHEPFVESVEELAERIVRNLGPLRTAPLTLFGHSMGAAVAFEVARRLDTRPSDPPRQLIVSGRRAPSTTREENVHRGTDREVLAAVAKLDGTSARLLEDPEIVRMILPAIRNDYRAIELYRPAPSAVVDLPILCLAGDRDPQVTDREASAWRAHTTGAFRRRTFPGGHFYLADHRTAVSEEISRFVAEGSVDLSRVTDDRAES